MGLARQNVSARPTIALNGTIAWMSTVAERRTPYSENGPLRTKREANPAFSDNAHDVRLHCLPHSGRQGYGLSAGSGLDLASTSQNWSCIFVNGLLAFLKPLNSTENAYIRRSGVST